MKYSVLSNFNSALGKKSDLVMVFLIVGIMTILFTPITPQMLDVLIIFNLAFGLMILLMTFYVEKPIEFSTFPSMLLIATLFRLSLNIAATRLILSDGDAGDVIGAIGSHVVSGNYVIGMIVFIVLIVVQYVVITNGAQRVAEVAARFTLDSMPGKQMAIDADMNIGIIDEQQAQERRKEIEREGSFYGAMDGASKFVKGDAIAGIIIILIDIVGGLTIGLAQLGMSWPEALKTYTLLTVGDGIVTQIPALIISTGTGIIVTRAATGKSLGDEISKQVISYPKIMVLISIGLILMLFLPGLPAIPILLVFSVVVFTYWLSRKSKIESEKIEDVEDTKSEASNLYAEMKVDPILIEIESGLNDLIGSDGSILLDQISKFRKKYALAIGVVIPQVIVKEKPDFKSGTYRVLIHGVEVASGYLKCDGAMVIDSGRATGTINGIETRDPSFGLPAKWIGLSEKEKAVELGYTVIDPLTVLVTHTTELLKVKTTDILTRKEVELLLDSLRKTNSSLVEEVIPGIISVGLLKKILIGLVDEQVSIRNLERIIDVLADEAKTENDTNILIELVRKELGGAIFQSLVSEENTIKTLVFDSTIELTILESINDGNIVLEPKYTEQLVMRITTHVEDMIRNGLPPIVLCSEEIRMQTSKLLRSMIPQLNVLSMSEIPKTGSVKSYAVVTM